MILGSTGRVVNRRCPNLSRDRACQCLVNSCRGSLSVSLIVCLRRYIYCHCNVVRGFHGERAASARKRAKKESASAPVIPPVDVVPLADPVTGA